MMAFSGSCSCGAVKFRLTAAPMFVHCCHCTDCQRQTGSAFVLNALIEADRVEVEGEVSAWAMPTDSGRTHDVLRCKACGVALWSEYGAGPILKFMRVGTLDEPAQLAPDVHIYTRSKQPWVQLPEAAKVFETYYDSAKVWPAEALERRAALFAAA